MRTLIVGALAATMAGCSSRMPPHANLVSDVNGVTYSRDGCRSAARTGAGLIQDPFRDRENPRRHRGQAQTTVVGPPSALACFTKTTSAPAHNAAADSVRRSQNRRFTFRRRRRREPQGHHDPTTGRGRDGSRRTNRGGAGRCSSAQRTRLPGGPGHGAPGDQVGRRSQRKNHCDRRPAGCIHEQGLDRDGGRGGGALPIERDQAKPVDRLIDGEVPAAVLTLVSAEAAGSFPDIAGTKSSNPALAPID